MFCNPLTETLTEVLYDLKNGVIVLLMSIQQIRTDQLRHLIMRYMQKMGNLAFVRRCANL